MLDVQGHSMCWKKKSIFIYNIIILSYSFGSILDVWIARKPPGFAYVTFKDPEDARDACRENGRQVGFEIYS